MAFTTSPRKLITSIISSLTTEPATSPTEHKPASPLTTAEPPLQKALLTLHILFPNELLPALDLLDRNLITRLVLAPTTTNNNKKQNEELHPTNPHPQHPPHLQPHLHPTANEDSNPNDSLPRPTAQDSPLLPTPPARRTGGHAAHHPAPARGQTVVWRCRSSRGAEGAVGYGSSRGRYAEGRARGARGSGLALKEYEVRLESWSCSCPAFAFVAFPAASPEFSAGERFAEGWKGGIGEGRCEFGGRTLGEDVPVCKHLLACVLVEHCGVFAGMAEERVVSVEEVAGLAAGWAD